MTDRMNRCGTCRYFGLPHMPMDGLTRSERGAMAYYHTCDFIKHGNDYGKNNTGPTLPANPGDAVVVDGEGYHAALFVTEDFGCVKWVPA